MSAVYYGALAGLYSDAEAEALHQQVYKDAFSAWLKTSEGMQHAHEPHDKADAVFEKSKNNTNDVDRIMNTLKSQGKAGDPQQVGL
jgi:hypothetical protein